MTRQKLPIGFQTFADLRQEKCYYVDKTSRIEQLVRKGRYYFLSRPRRFGKSLLLDTLQELFEGNESLFQGLHIHESWDWSVNHPVVRLSFDGKYACPEDVERSALKQLEIIGRRVGLDVSPGDSSQDYLLDLLNHLHHVTGRQVVVLVDEYDKPILDVIDNKQMATANRDQLGGIYGIIKGSAEHVRFVFVTGVSMFSKVSLFSYLNNLTDISLKPDYATICGYTDHDLESVFAPEMEGLDREEIRRWYNGYHWLGEEKVYNPWDILNLFDSREFAPHWFRTGSPTFLYKVMMEQRINPMALRNRAAIEAVITTFNIDDINFDALLFQAGYLTITAKDSTGFRTRYTLDYPNLEVRQSLKDELLVYLSEEKSQVLELSDSLIGLLLMQDFEQFTSHLRSFLAGLPYQWQGERSPARYEAWYEAMLYAALDTPKVEIRLEESSSRGRADMVLLHGGKVFVFEFKMVELSADATSEEREMKGEEAVKVAIGQIRDRCYMDKYRRRQEPMFLIGMAFDRSGKGEKPLALKAVPA
ncbi:MAG: AAA family ATPase [Gammaproteobacteria bacterium]|nr:AAA family ATPase [Gammaproteobacteria bacterium]